MMALSTFAQGPYAPAAGHVGSLALHKDSAVFKDWASAVTVVRGKQDISNPSSDTTNFGIWSAALGAPDANIVSLGDHGQATVSFSTVLYNGVGPDFAVFENAFNNTFLELAFVEVSSDGVNFHRFPAHSLTDTLTPVGSFGAVDPSMLYNLAGKYRGGYGTPFDLEELQGINGLDLQHISHIRIIDVVGTLNHQFAQRDSYGRKINDIYPTPFPSGGFDLDAIGAIHIRPVGIPSTTNEQAFSVYPNPTQGVVYLTGNAWKNESYVLRSISGAVVQEGQILQQQIQLRNHPAGIYWLEIAGHPLARTKLLIQ